MAAKGGSATMSGSYSFRLRSRLALVKQWMERSLNPRFAPFDVSSTMTDRGERSEQHYIPIPYSIYVHETRIWK